MKTTFIHPSGDVTDMDIMQEDLETLNPNEWINDTVNWEFYEYTDL